MFDPYAKYTGTRYTLTVALLSVAFLFVPATVVLSGRFGYLPISLAVATSLLCLVLAWFNGTRYSRVTIPSMEPPTPRTH